MAEVMSPALTGRRQASTLPALLLLIFTMPAAAEVTTIVADADNTIYEDETEYTCGGGPHIIAGETKNGVSRRALLRFDIAANLPANSTINSEADTW